MRDDAAGPCGSELSEGLGHTPRFTPESPPRCRRPDETAQQYRVAMGWDAPPEDERAQCKECFGKGYNDEFHAVDGHYNGGETFRMECRECGGAGKIAPEPEHPLMDFYMEARDGA